MSFKNKKYQGWKNYYTWNIALCIDNERGLYIEARDFMKSYKGRSPYIDFLFYMNFDRQEKTIDGVKYHSRFISRREMNSYMNELR